MDFYELMNNPGVLQVLLALLAIAAVIVNARAYRSNKEADRKLLQMQAEREAQKRLYDEAQAENARRFEQMRAENERRMEEVRRDTAESRGIQRILDGLLKANIESNDNAAKERKASNDTVHSLTSAIAELAESNRGVIAMVTEFRTFSAQQHQLTRASAEKTKTAVDESMQSVVENLIIMHGELVKINLALQEGSPYLKQRLQALEAMISRALATIQHAKALPTDGKDARPPAEPPTPDA